MVLAPFGATKKMTTLIPCPVCRVPTGTYYPILCAACKAANDRDWKAYEKLLEKQRAAR